MITKCFGSTDLRDLLQKVEWRILLIGDNLTRNLKESQTEG